ncbi:glycosyltransferase family 4 protein [Thermosynechococcaceae cyanobacterium BACA0444]|uniref:Glycosyltransferase family 4 protein n=1 Tax=Pseudocalidococcus azoricus BACA0444 TaxID=2918990 RepID=A0AAE4JX76_9CYAN|nr:glycosyltransferase family 4 protein [Pseudocalidococcus azoricus]MDS3862230.1 glycosyltransferase family 4 protein [Pseudocalidococcus azoricus BACA0444]
MKILFFSAHFWPYIAGGQIMGAQLVKGLQRNGHEVTVVTAHDTLALPDKEKFFEVPLYRFRFWHAVRDRNAELIFKLRQDLYDLKKSLAPDLVHMSSISPIDLFHWHTVRAAPVPTLLTIQGSMPTWGSGTESIAIQTLNSADWICACSTATLDEAIRLSPTIQSRTSIIHNGKEPTDIVPAPLPSNPPHIICIGRLEQEKGFDLAINAFARVLKIFPTSRLTLVGDGSKRKELATQTQKLGISERVFFRGWVAPEQIPDLMNSATIVLVPSRREAFGLVALEAALLARPVIASAVGGLPEVIVNRESGILVPIENSQALAQAVIDLLQQPETMIRLGKFARQHAIDHFSFDRYLKNHVILYKKLIK